MHLGASGNKKEMEMLTKISERKCTTGSSSVIKFIGSHCSIDVILHWGVGVWQLPRRCPWHLIPHKEIVCRDLNFGLMSVLWGLKYTTSAPRGQGEVFEAWIGFWFVKIESCKAWTGAEEFRFWVCCLDTKWDLQRQMMVHGDLIWGARGLIWGQRNQETSLV